MVEIEYDKVFIKHFRTRISPNNKFVDRYKERVAIFIKDRQNQILKDHKLIGKMRDKRAFSITGDIRIVYIEVSDNHFVFLDIGTHPQIYGM